MRKLVVAALLLGAVNLQAADSGKGKAIYASKCSSCHGKDAKGNAALAKMFRLAPAALALIDEETLSKSDEELSSVTLKGKGKMTAFAGKLKPEEVADLLAYLRSLGPKKEEKAGEEEKKAEPEGEKEESQAGKEESKASTGPDLEAAAKLYSSKCSSCHGKSAKGNAALARMFKVEPAALDLTDSVTLVKTDEELASATAEGKGNMKGFAGKLEDFEIRALVAYMRSLAGGKKEEKKEAAPGQ